MLNRLTLTLVVLTLLTACDDPLSSADPSSETAIENGKAIYDAHCGECHGANLEGQPDWEIPNMDGTLPAPPHDDTGTTWQRSDQLLFRSVKLGGQAIVPDDFTSTMPAFGETLTDQEIWQVLSYIKSQWSPMIRARQERMNTR